MKYMRLWIWGMRWYDLGM